MDLTGTKAIVLVLLGLIKLASGLAPLLLTKIFKRKSERFFKKFIGTVLCFGGGVLLSTVFIHMLREVRESLEKATSMGMMPKDLEFPFAELLICMGFLLILFIESSVHKLFGGHGHSHFPSQATLAKRGAGADILTDHNVAIDIPADNTGHDNSAYQAETPQKEPSAHFCDNKIIVGRSDSLNSSSSSDTDSLSYEPSAGSSKSSKKSKRKVVTSLRSFLMVLALSIHSIFEGMAIGLEETQTGVWKLFLAVSIHATAILFCIGTEMIAINTTRCRIVMYMVVLSVVTPIGVLIGIIVTIHMDQASGEQILIIGVLQGLAGGTLLYITFFEVLARDKLSKYGMSGLLGALAVMLGFMVMAGMEAGHGGHSHGGHAGHSGHAGHAHVHHDQAKLHNHDHSSAEMKHYRKGYLDFEENHGDIEEIDHNSDVDEDFDHDHTHNHQNNENRYGDGHIHERISNENMHGMNKSPEVEQNKNVKKIHDHEQNPDYVHNSEKPNTLHMRESSDHKNSEFVENDHDHQHNHNHDAQGEEVGDPKHIEEHIAEHTMEGEHNHSNKNFQNMNEDDHDHSHDHLNQAHLEQDHHLDHDNAYASDDHQVFRPNKKEEQRSEEDNNAHQSTASYLSTDEVENVSDNPSGSSDEYFVYNVTAQEFLHDSIAYD